MNGFDQFWQAWPKSTRKGAKAACLAKWVKHYHETQSDQIVKHVEWMKTTEDWLKHGGAFIPAPLTYLNQQRWDGAEVPDVRPKAIDSTIAMLDERDRLKAPIPQSVREQIARIKGLA